MKTKTFTLTVMVLMALQNYAQTSWQTIKDSATFIVTDTNYAVPYILPVNVGGWEDGVFMTRDGLNLYAFYSPVDQLSFSTDVINGDPCSVPAIAPYYRGPGIGVDTTASFSPCGKWMHSDIIRSTRNSTSTPFTAWDTTMISSYYYEGAPQIVQNPSTGLVEFFLFVRNNGASNEDIMWMRNTTLNPPDTASVMPLSTNDVEDNPHLERINGDTLVLFYDQDSKEGYTSDMFYSVSYNNGVSWSPVDTLSTLSVPDVDEVQPHLWKDPITGTWWLFYSTINTINNKQSIFRSNKSSADNTKWDDWDAPQLVITPDNISGSTDEIAAIGEPALTQWGDMTFVVAYSRNPATDTTDVYDADPWFLPRKVTGTGIEPKANHANNYLNIYPNPAGSMVTFLLNGEIREIALYNSKGQIVERINTSGKNKVTINTERFLPGLYFIQIPDNGLGQKFIIKNNN